MDSGHDDDCEGSYYDECEEEEDYYSESCYSDVPLSADYYDLKDAAADMAEAIITSGSELYSRFLQTSSDLKSLGVRIPLPVGLANVAAALPPRERSESDAETRSDDICTSRGLSRSSRSHGRSKRRQAEPPLDPHPLMGSMPTASTYRPGQVRTQRRAFVPIPTATVGPPMTIPDHASTVITTRSKDKSRRGVGDPSSRALILHRPASHAASWPDFGDLGTSYTGRVPDPSTRSIAPQRPPWRTNGAPARPAPPTLVDTRKAAGAATRAAARRTMNPYPPGTWGAAAAAATRRQPSLRDAPTFARHTLQSAGRANLGPRLQREYETVGRLPSEVGTPTPPSSYGSFIDR